MKFCRCLAMLGVLALLVFVPACSKSDEGSGGPPSFDLAQIQSAFASATGPIRTEFDHVVAAVKDRDYSGALSELQRLASNVSLSADQKAAVNGLIEQVKAKAGQAVEQAKEAAGKAMEQAKEAATKAASEASKAAADAADAAKKSAGNLLPK